MDPRGLPALLLAAFLAAATPGESGCGLSFCPRPEEQGSRDLEFGLKSHWTAFDIQGIAGGYAEAMATVQYTGIGNLALGLHAPFILLDAAGTEAGLGNLTAYAEYRARPDWLSAFGAGVQAEIPMPGASEHGLGDNHWMANQGTEPAPTYVHPHEHFEFLYRASAGIRFAGGSFLPEVFLDGQPFPILSDARVTWSAGLTLGWTPGMAGSRARASGET